jgi:protein-S-isoprenylcysteine O-methyltransferase Ste14
MKYTIRIVLIITVLIIVTGLVLLQYQFKKANFVVGIGVLLFAFVLLPLFLYHRYKGKKLTDYTLDKDKINQIFDNLNS